MVRPRVYIENYHISNKYNFKPATKHMTEPLTGRA